MAADVRVDDGRLPAAQRRVYPWHVLEIRIPDDLIRPVLLLRPSRKLIAAAVPASDAHKPFHIEIHRGNRAVLRAIFDGHAILVGAGPFSISRENVQAWTEELKREQAHSSTLQLWKDPTPAFADVRLSPGEELSIKLMLPDGSVDNTIQVICGRPTSPEDIPQVVDLP
jgi:hypothetical protein